jgi:uncharacterized protein YndB with AHSA1/START domain
MISFDVEITINRPVETVFAFVSDPSAYPQWQPAVVENRQTSTGPIGVGTTGVNVRQVLGQRIESTWQVTSYTPNEGFGLKSTSGPVAYELTNSFQAVDGSTRLGVHFQGDPKGFFKVAEPLLAGTIEKEFEENNHRLKTLLESR